LFEAISHLPPAFSQSAFVVYCEKSLALPDGLAEGELDELPDPPVVPLPVEVPEAGTEACARLEYREFLFSGEDAFRSTYARVSHRSEQIHCKKSNPRGTTS
jgi:hypothetical protein